MHKLTIILAMMLLLVAIGIARNAEVPAADRVGPLDVIPIQTAVSGAPIEVTVAFVNRSDDVFRYLPASPLGPAFLSLELWRDGERIAPLLMPGDIGLFPANIRELGPGESMVQTLAIHGEFGHLPPGRYALRARSREIPPQLDLTPFEVDRILLYLDVRADAEDAR